MAADSVAGLFSTQFKEPVKAAVAGDEAWQSSWDTFAREVEAIAAVVLAIVGEVTVELAAVIAELAIRVEALEAKV